MNCNNVQELLPLYAGNDLEDINATLVGEHLRSCAECSVSAEAYHETMQMFQQFTPPPFDETVYAGIRKRVLREIEQESTAPTLRQLVATLLGQCVRWAVAASFILAFSAFSIYFVANRTSGPHAAGSEPTDRIEKGDVPATAGQEPGIRGENREMNTTAAVSDGRESSLRRKVRVAATDPSRSMTRATAKHPKTGPAILREKDLAAIPARDPEKTLRMEIQTRDPNIRIIWFSNQPAKQSSRN